MEEMPMNIDHKKPENRPLYIFALIAVGVILFLNIFAIPAMQERSVEKTDYSTFLSNVERGNVSKAEVQDDAACTLMLPVNSIVAAIAVDNTAAINLFFILSSS